MDNKFDIGNFVFWYSGEEVASYGEIIQITLNKKGYKYLIYDETDRGDYPERWHEEEGLYNKIEDLEILASRLRSDCEEWIKDCEVRLRKRLTKEE